MGHWVLRPKILMRRLGSLSVRIERGLVLLQKLLLHGYIMVGDAKNGEPVLRLLDLLALLFLRNYLSYKLVLDQNQRLH